MQIFPNNPSKRKDLYPSYMTKKADGFDKIDKDDVAGAAPCDECGAEPANEAFDAIKDLPMFGGESPIGEEAPIGGAPISDEEKGESKPANAEEALAEVKEELDEVQIAVSDAVKAVENATEAVGGPAAEGVSEVPDSAVVEVEVVDDGEPTDKIKKEGEPEEKEACGAKETPAVGVEAPAAAPKKGEKKPAPEAKKEVEAAVEGKFVRISKLSPQTRKEVYDYWTALGMPEDFCKALTKV